MKKSRSKPGKTPNNPVSERRFREALLFRAKTLGCDIDLKQIFIKFDNALKKCTNEKEYKHISACGAAEIHKLFGCRGGLVVDGVVVIPAESGHEDGVTGGKVIKL